MDKQRFKKKYILGLLTRPLFLCLTVGGISSLVVFGLLHFTLGTFLGLASMLIGSGILLQDFIMGNEKIALKAQMELEQEDRQEQNKAIEHLQMLLSQDRDSRTNQALKDLRALADAYKGGNGWSKQLFNQGIWGLSQTVDAIIKHCIESLKSTLEISKTAEAAATEQVKKVILAQRDQIIRDVQESITKLSLTLGQLQLLKTGGLQKAQLDDLGKELLTQLEIAKNVDKRLRSIDLSDNTSDITLQSLTTDDISQPPQSDSGRPDEQKNSQ